MSKWEVIGGVPVQKRKAGIMLVERKAGRWNVLAPWAEGPCPDGIKTYGLAKGSNDEGETPWQAAVREMKEETHIDLIQLFNERHKPDKKKKYPGVTLKLWGSESFPPAKSMHSFINPTHKRLPCWLDLYVFEVQGLDNLKKHSKGPESDNSPKVAADVTAYELNKRQPENKRIPDFKVLLNILRTGRIPESLQVNQRTGERTLNLFYEPVLPMYEELYEKRHYDDWRRLNYFDIGYKKPQPVSTPEQLQRLCAEFCGDEKFNSLLSQSSRLRSYLEQIGRVNDSCGIKFDDKQFMLMPLQEGSDILPFEVYLKRLDDVAKLNPMYRQMMFDRSYRDLRNGELSEGESLADALLHIHDELNERERYRQLNSPTSMEMAKRGTSFGSVEDVRLGADVKNVPRELREKLNRTASAASGYNVAVPA